MSGSQDRSRVAVLECLSDFKAHFLHSPTSEIRRHRSCSRLLRTIGKLHSAVSATCQPANLLQPIRYPGFSSTVYQLADHDRRHAMSSHIAPSWERELAIKIPPTSNYLLMPPETSNVFKLHFLIFYSRYVYT